MTVRWAVWAMILTSTLALLAVGVFLFVNLEFIAAQLHLKSDVAPAIQKWTKDQIAAHFPSSNLDKLVGSVNMIVQGLNAVVTFSCSKFVR